MNTIAATYSLRIIRDLARLWLFCTLVLKSLSQNELQCLITASPCLLTPLRNYNS